VIASDQGSEVYNQPRLEPEKYEKPHIYNQPDSTLPGFNPNEEHAFMASSGGAPPIAYALRRLLNYMPDGTMPHSEPWVLVKYWDPSLEEWAMQTYLVVAEDDTYKGRRPMAASIKTNHGC